MEKNDRCIVFLSNIRGNLDGLLGVVRAVCGDKDPFDQSSRSPFPEPEFRKCHLFLGFHECLHPNFQVH